MTTNDTRDAVETRYRAEFPLLAAYLDIITEYSDPERSINEPHSVGIDCVRAAELALDRIGRPARDRTDVLHADTYIQRLIGEMQTEQPQKVRTIQDCVIAALHPFAGCVPTAEDWANSDHDDKEYDLDEVMHHLGTDHSDDLRRLLRETLAFAMPAVLANITEQDSRRRVGVPEA